jgi:predicted Zn-dependent protease
MSTLSISPAIDMRVRKPQTKGSLRLTRRGRVVAVLAFLALAFAVMTTMSGWASASLSGGDTEPVRVVTVQPGDTLYGIAGEVAEDGEVREMVHRIQRLNSLPGASIEEGQKLAIPAG